MTWSEVMGRITVQLTVSSAALVVLALVTQATGFGVAFHVLSIGLTFAVATVDSHGRRCPSIPTVDDTASLGEQ